MVLLLIASAAQAEDQGRLQGYLPTGCDAWPVAGFLLGHLREHWRVLPEEHRRDRGIPPRGSGPSVRRLISRVVRSTAPGSTQALRWSRISTGARPTMRSDGRSQWFAGNLSDDAGIQSQSDIFGERGILLGAVHGIVESLSRWFIRGPNARASLRGLGGINHRADLQTPFPNRAARGVRALDPAGRVVQTRLLRRLRSGLRDPAGNLRGGASGDEIRSIIGAYQRLQHPIGQIRRRRMSQLGIGLRAEPRRIPIGIDPVTAGIYIATMIAQVDLLKQKGPSLPNRPDDRSSKPSIHSIRTCTIAASRS